MRTGLRLVPAGPGSVIALSICGLSSLQSLNRYASVLGNPISAIDMSGLCIALGTYGPFTPAMIRAAGGYCKIQGPTIGPLSPGVTIPTAGGSGSGISWHCGVVGDLGTAGAAMATDATVSGLAISVPTEGAGLVIAALGVAGTVLSDAAVYVNCVQGLP